MTKPTHTINTRQGEASTPYEELQEGVIAGVRSLVDAEHDVDDLIVGTMLSMLANTGACVDCTMSKLLSALNECDDMGVLHRCSDTGDKSKLN